MEWTELEKFCSKDFSRLSLMFPILDGEYANATDGHILVRVKGMTPPEGFGVVPPKDFSSHPLPAPGILDYLRGAIKEAADYTTLPVLPPDKPFEACQQCGGDGGHTCEDCDHFTECEACEGMGQIIPMTKVQINGVLFDLSLLRRVENLPGIKFHIDGGAPLKAQQFIFDGGYGVVMPLKPLPEDDEVIQVTRTSPADHEEGGKA